MRSAALIARSAVGIGAVLAVLYWAAGSPAHDAHLARSSPDFEPALVAAVGVVAWALALWFAAVVAAVTLAAGPGAAGRCGSRIARRLSPRFMHTAARWIVGATLIAGPLASTPALATSPPAGAGPSLDRPIAASVVVEPAAAPAAGLSGYPTNVSLDLDRPVARYLPLPPLDPKPAASTANPALLAGNTHRGEADDSYVVRRGDTLWDVAARHLGSSASAADIAREWPRWYAANRTVIGADPQLILPGTLLRAPAG